MKNLALRTISGLFFLALAIFCILHSQSSYLVMMSVVLVCSMFEFLRINMQAKCLWYEVAVMVLSFLAYISLFYVLTTPQNYILAFPIFFLLFTLVSSLTIWVPSFCREDYLKTSLVSIVYVLLPYLLFSLPLFGSSSITYREFSRILLSSFVLIWATDIGAYIFGCTLGQKYGPKLCSEISPKKSVVGLIGGIVSALFFSLAIYYSNFIHFVFDNVISILIFALIISVGGTFGDLVESIWKRNAGVKDSGRCIPGHGGMLDRMDSSMFAIPLAMIYVILMIRFYGNS